MFKQGKARDCGITPIDPPKFPTSRLAPAAFRRHPRAPNRPPVAPELLLSRVGYGMPTMQLPFTRDEFFDLFAAYNGALWPAVIGLWVASLLAIVSVLSRRPPRDRWISGLLAVHWAWAAVAYHIAFFTRINPAAWLFASIFLLQAALFLWLGAIRGRIAFTSSRTSWTVIGWLLVGFALLYPGINAVEHGTIVRIPTFGVPCPTTIFTVGLLLMSKPRTRALAIVPIVWSGIGGSAALLFGVKADYALLLAGALLTVFELQKSQTSSSAVPLHSAVER